MHPPCDLYIISYLQYNGFLFTAQALVSAALRITRACIIFLPYIIVLRIIPDFPLLSHLAAVAADTGCGSLPAHGKMFHQDHA